MNILFPVDEAYPLYKIGGLGDVGGSLPLALSMHSVDVRLVLPFHPEIDKDDCELVETYGIDYGSKELTVRLFKTTLGNSEVPVYLVAEDKYISESSDASDNNADKFAVFSLAISRLVSDNILNWPIDVIHCHDWHTALIPVILKRLYRVNHPKTVLTIHNLAYQGQTLNPVLEKLGFSAEDIKHWIHLIEGAKLSILLEGILASDLVTVVSPNHVHEIMTPEYGEGVEEYLYEKRDSIVGVLNGLDLETFNPAKDPYISEHYDVTTYQKAKPENKLALQQLVDLAPNRNQCLIGFVGRVDAHQKGIPLVIDCLKKSFFSQIDAQFVFLGTGDKRLERELEQALKHEPNAKIFLRYDEPLAAKIYAGADMVLIPSQYEPCGLVQMIAMRYGSLPVARATGGLVDTIHNNMNGFLFEEYSSEALMESINKAISIYHHNSVHWNAMIYKAMVTNFDWELSALKYIQLYTNLTHGLKYDNNI